MARVITSEQAIAQGISPASLRQVAAWNAERVAAEVRVKLRDRDIATMDRCGKQSVRLIEVADQVERMTRRPAHAAA